MSFRCKKCQIAQPQGKKPNRITIETRIREYFITQGEEEVKIGEGTEIVKQLDLCDGCVAKE